VERAVDNGTLGPVGQKLEEFELLYNIGFTSTRQRFKIHYIYIYININVCFLCIVFVYIYIYI